MILLKFLFTKVNKEITKIMKTVSIIYLDKKINCYWSTLVSSFIIRFE